MVPHQELPPTWSSIKHDPPMGGGVDGEGKRAQEGGEGVC